MNRAYCDMVPVDLLSKVDEPLHIHLHPWCKLGLCRRFPIPKNDKEKNQESLLLQIAISMYKFYLI